MANPYLKLEYFVNEPQAYIVETNVKPELIEEEIFSNWIRGQQGKGPDKRPPKIRDIYHLEIRLDLSDDSFHTSSDTGNSSLTAGIVIAALKSSKFSKGLLDKLSDPEFRELKQKSPKFIPQNYKR